MISSFSMSQQAYKVEDIPKITEHVNAKQHTDLFDGKLPGDLSTGLKYRLRINKPGDLVKDTHSGSAGLRWGP